MYFLIHDARSVVLVPEEAEDMWHAYNLIAVGDRLKSTTIRYVVNSTHVHALPFKVA